MSRAVLVEFKARCADLDAMRSRVEALGARRVGEDHQRDVYFRVPNGRLKLRLGPIERTLIHYHRADVAASKRSDVRLYRDTDLAALEPVLTAALGVDVVVDKRREIYRLGHVKLHLDRLEGLGTFVEVEVIDETGTRDEAEMRAECEALRQTLGVEEQDLLDVSYSDLVRATTA